MAPFKCVIKRINQIIYSERPSLGAGDMIDITFRHYQSYVSQVCTTLKPLLNELARLTIVIRLKFHRIIFSILCMIQRKPKTNRCNIDHGPLLWTEGYSGHAALCGLSLTILLLFSLIQFPLLKSSSLEQLPQQKISLSSKEVEILRQLFELGTISKFRKEQVSEKTI